MFHVKLWEIFKEKEIKMTDFKYFRRRNLEEYPVSSQVIQVKTDDIRANRAQPRADFDNNSIIRLADSIRRYGIIQPLTVRRSDSDDIYTYELVAGERRLRAARMLGYFTVPCIVIEADEQTSAELAIIENLLRKDLNMFEQAYGFKKLIENHGLTQDEVARKMSLSQSAVANKIRLLRLSDAEQRAILENDLSERHARALLRLDSHEARAEAIRYICEGSMNVLNTEQYIDRILEKQKNSAKEVEKAEKEVFSAEKKARQFISNIQKRIDALKKQGQEATCEVITRERSVEVRVVLRK